jgi:hypothetical protein
MENVSRQLMGDISLKEVRDDQLKQAGWRIDGSLILRRDTPWISVPQASGMCCST